MHGAKLTEKTLVCNMKDVTKWQTITAFSPWWKREHEVPNCASL